MSAQGDTTRLFLALWPDDAVRDQLRVWRDAWTWPRGATPVHTDKLHVTLHFLGNQPTARLPEFLDGFQVPFEPFDLQFGRPALQRSGFAWIEPLSRGEMHTLFWGLAALALTMAAGLAYRITAPLFALGLTYIQLLDVSTYLNH